MKTFLLFTIAKSKFALPVEQVTRVIHAARINPLPDAPEDIIGLLNVAGEMVPVITLEPRLGMKIIPTGIYDYFILLQIDSRSIAIKAQELNGTLELEEKDVEKPEKILNGMQKCVEGLFKLSEEIVLISPGEFLHLDDETLFTQIKAVGK